MYYTYEHKNKEYKNDRTVSLSFVVRRNPKWGIRRQEGIEKERKKLRWQLKRMKEKVDRQNVIKTLINGEIVKDFKDRSSRLKSSKNPVITLKYSNMSEFIKG